MTVDDSGWTVLIVRMIGVLFYVDFTRATKHDNRHAFEVLCGLYRLAEAPVKVPDVALTKPIPIDLIKLNMTTADDDWYTLFGEGDPATWDEAKKLGKFKPFENDAEWPQMYPEWLKAKKELLEDAKGRKEFLRPPASHQREIGHVRIRRLWRRFLEEEEERNTLNSTLKNLETDIGKKFNAARFGSEGATAPSKESFDGGSTATDRTKACGGSTGTNPTGTSLANDLVCICTATAGGHANSNECAQGYDGSSKAWSSGLAAIVGEVNQLVQKCPKNPENFKVTAGSIRGNLTKFWGALGKTAESTHSIASTYVLGGVAVSGGDCQGGSLAAVCVNYKANLKDSSAEPKGIPWLTKLEEAAAMLDEIATEEKKIHALNARAESLRDAAWASYEEALLPDQTGAAHEPTANLSKTDRPAATVPGSSGKNEERSDVTTPRFIFPWTLLI